MKPRLAIILALIVLAPLALLAGLAVRVARDEREVVQHRVTELITATLRDADGALTRLMQKRERELGELLENADLSTSGLRELTRTTRGVSQAFLLNTDGSLAFPATDIPLSQRERAFLDETAPLWQGKMLFRQAMGDAFSNMGQVQTMNAPVQTMQQSAAPSYQQQAIQPANTLSNQQRLQQVESPPKIALKSLSRQTEAPVTRGGAGWHAWNSGGLMRMVFYERMPDGRIAGVELDSAALLSEVIAQLPATEAGSPNPAEGLISLVDANGKSLYQWGGYRPPEKAQSRVTMPLSPPLGAWRLDYFAPDSLFAGGGQGFIWNMALGLGAVALALVGLATYFYRESSREAREAANRVTFVNQVSHELKTPLTNIRMYAELLDTQIGAEEEKSRHFLGVIVSESQRLSRLIGNILTFSRQQRAKLKLNLSRGVVDETVRAILDHFAPSFQQCAVSVDFRPAAGDEVLMDTDVVGQILGNLLNNIEKYAPGGKVTLETRQAGSRVTVLVADSGPGIPRNQRQKVFEPFYRVSNKLTDGVTGTGIGLAIARDLARLHGGDLRLIESESGAKFELTLAAEPSHNRGDA
ncbi:MAG: HAMP domain-containing histidine kinase [Candidatus Sumerlaeaceae bacterium]|nr:HAMP domain-containing histidine kinase [Candidatus Sumerlaeaceae bacterium]